MFGFGRNRALEKAVDDYLMELATRVDRGYGIFMQAVVQVLVDYGMDANVLKRLLNDKNTKWRFFIGICSEQLMAAKNVFGSKKGSRFSESAISKLSNSSLPFDRRQIKNDASQLLKHCEEYPMHTRVTILLYILDKSELPTIDMKEKIIDSPIIQTIVNATMLSDGIGGIVKEVSQRHEF